jgi:undecaprenyl-diphosphatase
MIESLKTLDRFLLFRINSLHSPLSDIIMWELSRSWHTVLAALISAYAISRRRSFSSMVSFTIACVVIFICTDFSANMIKHGVGRYRPTHNTEISKDIHVVNEYRGGKFGFVSSHAANVFGITTAIFFGLSWLPRKYRYLFFFYPALISYSRVYMGVHYPSDVILGGAYGILIACLVFYLMQRDFFRRKAGSV